MNGQAWPLRHGGQMRAACFCGVVYLERSAVPFVPGAPPPLAREWRLQGLTLSVDEAIALHASLPGPITVAEEYLTAVRGPVLPWWALGRALVVAPGLDAAL